MAKDTDYETLVVESFLPSRTSGLHGKVHVRPVEGQGHPTTLKVECAKPLSEEYPVGTRFLIRAKLTDRADGGEYLYSSWRWPVEVISQPNSN
ncbi:hypothetical protein GCM10022268_25460 [Sphingomonas cynarae]|uniref:Uncharacterized protein n=1 Tax=Sphingomonas cynarae TaxID=930197 RepID=A0ABP7E8L3_9SPHN